MIIMEKSTIKKLTIVSVAGLLILSTIAALFLIDFGEEEEDDSLQVVATFYPLYYFSKEIGGDRAKVTSLIPNNMEPHSWNPKPSDIISTSKADVFVYNGAGFEPWVGDFLDQLGDDVIVVDASDDVALGLSDEVEELYSTAELSLSSGPFFDAMLSFDAPHPQIELAEGCYNITFDICSWNNCTARGGSIWLNVSEEGDFRMFLDVSGDVKLLDENGTEVALEMKIGDVADHPTFKQGLFMELPTGLTRLSMNNTSSDKAHLVVLMPAEEGGEHEEGHEHGLNDPHFWLDPLNAKVQADSIANAFAQADPGNATYYHGNAAELKQRLDELDDAFRTGLENRTKNDIVTTHEGFNYLAKRYSINAHAAIGISGDEQPSAQDMVRLTDLINELDINYVYSEPTYSDAIMEQISAQTGAEVLVLDGVHGQSGVNAEKDYFEIMYANLESLKIGLEVDP